MPREEKGNGMNSKDTMEVTLTVETRAEEQRKWPGDSQVSGLCCRHRRKTRFRKEVVMDPCL